MSFKQELLNLIDEIKKTKVNKTNDLNNNAYFLKDGILLKENKSGDPRYPYTKDGRTLWVHQNGNMSFNESDFFILSEALEGEKNFFSFFLGVLNKDKYIPVSLFEINKNIFESKVSRFTVFKKSHAYFILEYKKIYYALKITVDDNKNLIYKIGILNNNKEEVNIYSSMYLNFNLMHGNHDSVETKWFKKSTYLGNTFIFETVEDISRYEHINSKMYLTRSFNKEPNASLNTTSRGVYSNGKTCNFDASDCLIKGEFSTQKHLTSFSDLAIAGDLNKFSLSSDEFVEINYCLSEEKIDANYLDSIFDENQKNTDEYYNNEAFIKFDFKKSDAINDKLFTRFISEVVNQVDYCARTKNSTLKMLGIRDIFQAIEAGLMWNKKEARRKIIEALNYVSLEGRLPRQYSLRTGDTDYARVDDRLFIDQGLWVIDCLHRYLSYTNDASILNEVLGYVEFNNQGLVKFLDEKGTLLEHLYRIVDFLIANIDSKTKCLKTLFGDWNDAVDGLGKGKNYSGFGDGVSAMATFQLYSSLTKIVEIIKKYDGENCTQINKYLEAKEVIKEGIKTHLFVTNGEEYKIIHGWGNQESFYVGTFNDLDGKSRDSLTSNAFYIISDYCSEDSKYIDSCLNAYQRLDSKYGFKTFEPFFDKDAEDVGRIINLPKGTAENAATYIHGTVFAIDSLFIINEPELAFEQIFKILPLTHKFVSTTPFIMPNSYIENSDIDVDGESMNDWFTGSSSTLIKTLVRNVFGINPTLDDLIIQTSSYFPFKESSISIYVENTKVNLTHKMTEKGNKEVIINGKKIKNLEFDENGRLNLKIKKNNLPKELNIIIKN